MSNSAMELRKTILHILCNTVDTEKAINKVLSTVGMYYGVDRAYVIENSDDGLTCSNTYEWCNTGIVPEIQMLQNVRYKEDLGISPDYFFKDGDLFVCKDTSKLNPKTRRILKEQNITGVLFSAIRAHGELKGYVGFDNCSPEISEWAKSQEAIDMLEYTAHLMTLSIMNYHNSVKQMNELKKAQAQAEKANAAKTNFLSQMSHDMRTPMNGILGLVTLMLDEDLPQNVRENLVQIQMSGKYLLNLINDTLDVNKIEANKIELHPIVSNAFRIAENVETNAHILASEKGVDFQIQKINPETLTNVALYIDEGRVEQIFMNLISNAVKFTPKGGSVKLTVERLESTDEYVKGRYQVIDNGIGMTKEFQKHIFEPFSQEGRISMNRESGTGLGMTIVHKLVEMMGGTLELKSEINKGTTFTLVIKAQRYIGKVEQEKKPDFLKVNLRGKQILLCEDHPLNRQIAAKLLEKQDMTVDIAENGEQGLKKYMQSDIGHYDMVLMDVRMPIMDGLQATRNIRLLNRDDAKTVPIVAMTANAFDDDIKNCLDAGMNAHISKPIDVEKMYRVIADQLQIKTEL